MSETATKTTVAGKTGNSPSSNASHTGKPDLQSDVDALKSDLTQLRGDVKGLASDAVETGRIAAQDAKVAAEERWNDGMDSMQTYVRQKPWHALGIAFALGIVATVLFGRK